MPVSMRQEVGMTRELRALFMTCWQKTYWMGTIWSPTPHSHKVLEDALGRYAPPFVWGQIYRSIRRNAPGFSPSTLSFSHFDNQWSGGCEPCKVHLAGSAFLSPLRMSNFGKTCWRYVSASITSGCGVLA